MNENYGQIKVYDSYNVPLPKVIKNLIIIITLLINYYYNNI